jgi:hypothetical protein
VGPAVVLGEVHEGQFFLALDGIGHRGPR